VQDIRPCLQFQCCVHLLWSLYLLHLTAWLYKSRCCVTLTCSPRLRFAQLPVSCYSCIYWLRWHSTYLKLDRELILPWTTCTTNFNFQRNFLIWKPDGTHRWKEIGWPSDLQLRPSALYTVRNFNKFKILKSVNSFRLLRHISSLSIMRPCDLAIPLTFWPQMVRDREKERSSDVKQL